MDPISFAVELELATLLLAAIAGFATTFHKHHQVRILRQRERHHQQMLALQERHHSEQIEAMKRTARMTEK
jgi:hypothetical protein